MAGRDASDTAGSGQPTRPFPAEWSVVRGRHDAVTRRRRRPDDRKDFTQRPPGTQRTCLTSHVNFTLSHDNTSLV